MEQEKIGKLIKDLRTSNNLTQAELADKLGVTYQAVSKWENGKNIPDIAILKEISNMFNIDISEIIEGTRKKKKKSKLLIISIISCLLLVCLIVFMIIHFTNNHKKDDDFTFKVINTTCQDFKISGSLAYNKDKSYIYISNIEFCGEEDIVYSEIDCVLYEKNGNLVNKISECNKGKNETLKEHLSKVKLSSDNYKTICNDKKQFYLEINAIYNDKTTTYKIPLNVEDTCKN